MAIEVRNKKDIINLLRKQQNEIEINSLTLYKLGLNTTYKEQGLWINKFVKNNLNWVKRSNYKYVFISDVFRRIRIHSLLTLLLLCVFISYHYYLSFLFNAGRKSYNTWEKWLTNVSFFIIILTCFVFFVKTRFFKTREKNIRASKKLYKARYLIFLSEIEILISELSEKEFKRLLDNM